MNDEEIPQKFIDQGYFEVELNEFGEKRYKATDKLYEDYPEVGEEWDHMIGDAVFSLWNKGFIEINFTNDGLMMHPLPDTEKFNEIDTLNSIEREILASIQYLTSEQNDD